MNIFLPDTLKSFADDQVSARGYGTSSEYARQALGRELGARAEELVFVPNSTTGVNVVAQSFHLQPGDEVLTTSLEYGACDATWQRMCAKAGAASHPPRP